MDCLGEFVERLLDEGRIVFRGRPSGAPEPARAIERLGSAYARYRLEVAGPLIPFDARVALEASEVVRQASWALVSREESLEALGRRIVMTRPPTAPEHHLSADLVLRYLPQVARRARARDPGDPFAVMLDELLKTWPLSGVLGGGEEGPSTPPDFGGHEGLMLLYAERWARHEAPAWRPSGRALEYAELVLIEAGRGRPECSAAWGDDHE